MKFNKKESEGLINLNHDLHVFMAEILRDARDKNQIEKANEGFNLAFRLTDLIDNNLLGKGGQNDE